MGFASYRVAAAATLLAACAAAQSAPVASQAPDQISGTNMSFALVADNFSVSGGSYNITNLRFWSIQSLPSDYRGSVSWAIHADGTGAPGSVLSSGVSTPAALATGLSTGFDYAEYVFDIAVNFQLGVGDYWLALHNGLLSDNGESEMLWETSSAVDSTQSQYFDTDLQAWFETGNQQAFEITGSRVGDPVVPEPGSLALVLGALIAARTVRGRQSQR